MAGGALALRGMRTLLILLLLTGIAHAEPLGLRFGMSIDEIKAAKPCEKLVDVPGRGLACAQTRYAELDVKVDLDLYSGSLQRIAMSGRLGTTRAAAERAVKPLLAQLTKEYGPVEWIGASDDLKGGLTDLAPLFDNVDRTHARFKARAAAMFAVIETKASKIHVGGQLQRDKLGYAVELTFRPVTKQAH